MNKTLVMFFVVLIARSALAAPVVEYFADAAAATDPTRIVRASFDRPVDLAGPGSVTVYDNYTAPGDGGLSRFNGVYASQDHQIEDDIGSPVQQSQMSAYYILFSNRSATSRLDRFSYELEFVALSGQSLGISAFSVDLSLFPLPTQSTGVLRWPDGSLLSQNIMLPGEFLIRQRLFDPVGIAASELGMPFGGPRTVGSSSTGFQNLTTGQFVDLGDTNTLRIRIRGNVVPSPPSAASLFAASSLLALRRRRTLNAKY